jgi:hypothetical protein
MKRTLIQKMEYSVRRSDRGFLPASSIWLLLLAFSAHASWFFAESLSRHLQQGTILVSMPKMVGENVMTLIVGIWCKLSFFLMEDIRVTKIHRFWEFLSCSEQYRRDPESRREWPFLRARSSDFPAASRIYPLADIVNESRTP